MTIALYLLCSVHGSPVQTVTQDLLLVLLKAAEQLNVFLQGDVQGI